MLTTTLTAILAHGPCACGWTQLTAALGPEWGADTPIPLSRIIETNGAADAIWALRACGPKADRDRISRLFACRCADRALALVPNPDPRSVEAVAVARRYALGQATDEELAAAGAAAGDAAWAAAGDAAWAAAGAAAGDAAGDAAWAAARTAAWAAAGAAAGDAAWAAARDVAWAAARRDLLELLGGALC